MSRGSAILATAAALALLNVGLAALIVQAVGARTSAPLWLWVALCVLGVLAAAGAVVLWRQYLAQARNKQ